MNRPASVAFRPPSRPPYPANVLNTDQERIMSLSTAAATLAAITALTLPALALGQGFKVEESTIDGMQKAIQDGTITCHGVVQAYLDRVKAYNGSCTALVTA